MKPEESKETESVNEEVSEQNDELTSEQDHADEAAAADVKDDEANCLSLLTQELDVAREELNRHKDAMLRLQADMDNQRKRLARELEKAHKFALERFMNELLPVRDSLERGLEAAKESNPTVESLLEGKALTLKMLGKVMQDNGLEVIDPTGEAFNPDWHEAVSMQPSDEHEPNTVMAVVQRGYKLNERIIRPAMVVVSS